MSSTGSPSPRPLNLLIMMFSVVFKDTIVFPPKLWTLFLPPPLAPDQNPCVPSPKTTMRAQQCRWERRIRPPRPTVPIDAANRPLSTPPNGLRTAHVPTAFPAAAAVTELPDDVNTRSIGRTCCVGTAGDGPYAAGGIVGCNRIVAVYASCT